MPPDLLQFNRTIVAIEYSPLNEDNFKPYTENGIPVEDTGYDIAVIFTGNITKEGMAVYEARWYNPPLQQALKFRFVIQPRADIPALYSEAYSW